MNHTKSFAIAAVVLTVVWRFPRAEAQAQLIPILQPGDPILALDFDVASNSNYPTLEAPLYALDGNPGTKYLNRGGRETGFIVTSVGARRVQSIQFTTANDAPDRDPASWALYGTFQPIVSTDNSAGQGENWTLINSGPLSLPDTRLALRTRTVSARGI